ncbi:mis18-binding protein 1 [Scomber scombrus]|uniref:mis18-binding protein 1 n=1 Tax=Scomber scombrus TaxID=13677 RepID=UPI002DDAC8F5|nr:mis18-binding protein 1 [Scomber scombrus]
MASYHNLSLLQHQNPRYESPAKVFAKLKSKVQREAICAKDPLCNVGENHGAYFGSPRRRKQSTWLPEVLKENHKIGCYRDEAEALTLSPISSPQKSLGYSYSDFSCKPVVEMPLMTDKGHVPQSRNQQTPTKRALFESTNVFHPLVSGFTGTSRSPVKKEPVENSCGGWMSEEDCAPLEKLMSPEKMFSPVRNRLRKRKWGQQEMNKVSSSTKEVCNEVINQPQERKSSAAFSEDGTHYNILAEDLGTVRGYSLPAEHQMNHEPMFAQPRSSALTRCSVALKNLTPMSPAKMFAWMKERENRQEQQEVHEVSSSTREHMDVDRYHQSTNTPPSTADNTGETVDAAFRGVPESVRMVNRPRLESADSQSDTDPSDNPPPAAPSQPVLFEDPLVLNSPRITIPKKNKAVFKHNKWSQHTMFPTESVIHLTKWFLRKNQKGLFVDGFCKQRNVPWNSNIIVERVSNSVLKTISGRVYILVGKMQWTEDSEFPKWFLKEFIKGFPLNWKELYEKFLSEPREHPSRQTEKKRAGRSIVAKMTSNDSAHNCTVKKHRQKPLKTPELCPPPAASSSSTKVSRSGRVIRPPLEYWKGERIFWDTQMNVTIYEGYDTSICQPKVSTTVCAISQTPARVLCSEGRKQYESTSDNEMPENIPLRRVKAPHRKRNRAKVNHEEKPPSPSEPPRDTLSDYNSSLEKSSGNLRRSNRKRSTTKSTHVNTAPPSKSKPEKPSTQKTKKETHNTNRHSVRGLRSRSSVSPLSGSTMSDDEVSQYLAMSSSDEDFTVKTKKRGKGAHGKRGEKAVESQPKGRSSRNKSSGESGSEPRKTARVTKQKQSKTSSPMKTLPKLTQSNKKHKRHKMIPQEQDEDDEEWTEVELIKLQQAVSRYPKHKAGYWERVARMVGTRSVEECHNQHTLQGNSHTPKKAKNTKKEKVESAQKAQDCPVISARAGTFKRKQQVRHFLEAMPKDDVEDAFSTAYMQHKRSEIPSMCLSEENDITLSNLEPVTPISTRLHEAKTPNCLYITPGMMVSPNRNDVDKYVYQLQKRIKKNQFNVDKKAPSSKSFTPTPTVKQKMRKCCNTENDTFVAWEMFPDQEPESGEEEDFYFSDND